MTLHDLYDWYLQLDGTLTRWMRGSTGPTVPGAPTVVDASITGTVGTVTWGPPVSNGGSAITGYTVIRIGGATQNLGPTVRSATYTGLTTGVTYTFTVAAVNAIGTGPAVSVSATGGSVTTVWGINNHEAFQSTSIAQRVADFGAFPVYRVYHNPWGANETYDVNTGTRGRCAYSWKGGAGINVGPGPGVHDPNTYSNHELATLTTARNTMIGFLESIPAHEQVWWAFHHEVNNGSLQSNGTYMEVLPADYLAIYHQMRLALTAAHLATGVEIIICCNFMMAANLTDGSPKWSDAWVPPHADCDCFTMDCYGDPSPSTGPNIYGGWPASMGQQTAYDCNYQVLISGTAPNYNGRLAFALKVIDRTGYHDSWGVWEFNSPQKNWDRPAAAGGNAPSQEHGRVMWTSDYIAQIQHPVMTNHTPARIALFWEENAHAAGVGAQDHRYGRLMVPQDTAHQFDNDVTNMGPVLRPHISNTPPRR